MDDYWEASKLMMNDSQFLESLRSFDKDNIDAKIIARIKPYVDNPDFAPEKASAAPGPDPWLAYHR